MDLTAMSDRGGEDIRKCKVREVQSEEECCVI